MEPLHHTCILGAGPGPAFQPNAEITVKTSFLHSASLHLQREIAKETATGGVIRTTKKGI